MSLQKAKRRKRDLINIFGDRNTAPTFEQGKVHSPLTKFNVVGQLSCVLCNTVVKSASLWKVHVNSKFHKANVISTKKLTEISKVKLDEPMPAQLLPPSTENDGVTPLCSEIKKNQIERPTVEPSFEEKKLKKGYDEITFKGFFDNPGNVKSRNLDNKDPENEWERFQKEITQEAIISNAIITDQQNEATLERQIKEINEQIEKWSKVLDLVKQKEHVSYKLRLRLNETNQVAGKNIEESTSDEEEVEEFSDWRAKKVN